MRRFAPPPSAIGPVHCHVLCFARRARARCGRQADLGGLPPRHNHGRLTRNQGDRGDALAFPASAGLPQRVRVLVASRYGWLRELNHEMNTAPFANQMPLTAQFGPVGGIRSRLGPPKTARTELPSTTALDQSIRPRRASQSSRTK